VPEHPEQIVVAAGGDGTLSLAASVALESLAGNASMPALIPMPMGTENLVARQFGFTRSAEQVVQTIRHGVIHPIDAGRANGKLFLIMATSGFDAEVVRRLHLTRRGHIRRLSYLWPMLRAIRKYSFPTLRVRVDGGETIECAWAMVFNLPQYGGNLLIEPGAIGDDGVFDVIAFRSGSILSGLRYVAEIWVGRLLKDVTVVRLRGETIQIESDVKTPYQLDGDYAGKLPLRIEMLPRAIRLVMPVKDD
ncbi:MAG: protein BmrU, partial [Planctomycetes bacterium]|nr:protein BmrU [Planctomycetota bacterium]